MYAVVLVGGFGTRLRPLTNDIPKPMLPVAHRPMIVELVERLALGGVTDVVLALGFKPEPFRAAFPGGRHDGVTIHYAVEPEPLDTGGAIAFAAREAGIDDTFVVANGDIITDLPITDLIVAHRAFGGAATLHLSPVDDPSAFGVVELDDAGAVQRFVEKPAPGETASNLINAGTYVFEPSVLDLIDADQRVSVERVVFPALADEGRLFAVSTTDYWLDTGRPDQYLRANLDIVRGHRAGMSAGIHPDADVHPSSIIVESVVGPSAVVEAGARVSGSALIGEARVAADAIIEDSIVAGTVERSATVTDCVVGASYTVESSVHVIGRRLPEPE